MTTQEFITRFDNNETFDEYELSELFHGDLDDYKDIELVNEEEGEHHRWNFEAYNIYKIQGRYFQFYGFIALTEMQENYYDVQPIEVKPVEKVITITEWEAI